MVGWFGGNAVRTFGRRKLESLGVRERVIGRREEASVPHQLWVERRVDHARRAALIAWACSRRGQRCGCSATPIAIDCVSPIPAAGEWQPAQVLSSCRPEIVSKNSLLPRSASLASTLRPSRASSVDSILPVKPCRCSSAKSTSSNLRVVTESETAAWAKAGSPAPSVPVPPPPHAASRSAAVTHSAPVDEPEWRVVIRKMLPMTVVSVLFIRSPFLFAVTIRVGSWTSPIDREAGFLFAHGRTVERRTPLRCVSRSNIWKRGPGRQKAARLVIGRRKPSSRVQPLPPR